MTDDSKADSRAPAHVPYATLLSSLESLRKNGIPSTGKIDKTFFDSYAGSVQVQLLSAYRFLGFIDVDNMVLPILPQVVELEAEARKPILRKVIEGKYSRILALDLKTISPGQMEEAFRAFGIHGSTLVRCERFFVKACTELGIPISARVTGKTRTTAQSRAGKRPKASAKRVEDMPDDGGSRPPENASSWDDRLLAKFPEFDPTWPDQLKAKWFEGFERFAGAKK